MATLSRLGFIQDPVKQPRKYWICRCKLWNKQFTTEKCLLTPDSIHFMLNYQHKERTSLCCSHSITKSFLPRQDHSSTRQKCQKKSACKEQCTSENIITNCYKEKEKYLLTLWKNKSNEINKKWWLHCNTCSRNHILRLHLCMWKQKTREKKNQSTDPIRSERKIWITTILLELSYAKTAPSISSPNVVLIARRHPTTYSPPPVTSILLRNKKNLST